MSKASFPIVSFEPFLSGGEAQKRSVAQELYDAFHTFGWVYLKDFGISQEEIDEMFAMSKKYFEQPLEEKLKYRLSSAETNQGYTPDGAETVGGTDHKECYEHRRFNNDLCPTEEELPEFRKFVDKFYAKVSELSKEVLSALALVMGLSLDFFSKAVANADPQLRLLHYMPTSRAVVETAGHGRITPHTDFGLCTILFQDSVGGLEVDPFHTGQFIPATPIRGTCVINVADLLQRWSNDKLRSTKHRVTSPQVPAEQLKAMKMEDLLPARYSTAFFVHPSSDVEIEPILTDGEKEAKYENINAGQWRVQCTKKNYRALFGGEARLAAVA